MIVLLFSCLAYVTLGTPFSISNQRPLSVPSIREQTEHLSLDDWIAVEEKIALERLLDNVAPSGRNAKDAIPGTVIASPSQSYPNYYFQCTFARSSLKVSDQN
jgi:glucoamylase